MYPVLACSLAVLVLLVAEKRCWLGLKIAAKLAASSSFVWAALSWGALDSVYGQLLLLGLCLCWLGDALLLPDGAGKPFLLGLLAFLLGHLAYTAAFFQLPLEPRAYWTAGAIAAVIGLLVLKWLWQAVESNMRLPVVVYVIVILLMVATAFAACRAGAHWLVFAGAALFALSDLAVARERFVSNTFANRAWGLPCYFTAQMLLAASLAAGARSQPPAFNGLL